MASYFTLTLDTTAPVLQIYMPSLVTNDSDVPITITSTENIGEVTRLYIIDAGLNRYDLIFQNDGTELLGTIHTNYTLGTAIIYCQVKDEVGNSSIITTKAFQVKNIIPIDGIVEIKPMSTAFEIMEPEVVVELKEMAVLLEVDD